MVETVTCGVSAASKFLDCMLLTIGVNLSIQAGICYLIRNDDFDNGGNDRSGIFRVSA